jgi:polypeptide N-acetylgalactosaminyltransferase
VSIIIPVHDEHLPTLLRSVHSILNRTPAQLLVEILLVDDASKKGRDISFVRHDRIIEFHSYFILDELKASLDMHIVKLEKTRVIRLEKRQGLIRTRMAGAREAKGEILIFFDSHIEVNVNWLPPLIEPIALNYKTSVCPFIDIIKWENFAYVSQDEGNRIHHRLYEYAN